MAEEYIESIQEQPEQIEQTQQQPADQDPPKKKLWQGLVDEDLYSKSYEEFQKQYSTPESIDKLHKGLIDENLYSKGIDDFYSQYFTDVKKKDIGQPSKTGGQNGKAPSPSPFPLPSQETKWEENPLNPLAAANKAQAQKEEAQKIMPQPTPTIGKKVVAKVTPTKVTPQRKPIAQLPEQDEEDDGFFAKAGEKLLGIMSPTLGAAAQAVSSIPNAKDYLKYVWNRTLETTGRMASGAGGLFIDALSMGDDPNIPKEELLKTYRDKVAKNIREAPHEYLGANISKEKTKEFDDNFVASTIAGLPGIMVQAAVPFGAGFVADAMDGAIQTINNTEEGRKLPESQKTIFELGAGLAIGGMTALGIDKILGKQTSKVANNLAMKTFADLMAKNEGQAITKEMFEDAIQQNSKSLYNKLISTGGKLAESSLVGGVFSAGTEVTNEVSKQLTNKLTDKQVFDPFSWGNFNGNVAKSFGHGAVTGFALGAITVPFNQAENGIKNEVLKAKTPQDIENLKAQVVEQVSQGSLDPIHAESIVNIIDSYNAANTKVPADVPNREEKVEIVKQKDDLKQAATNKLNETKTVDDAFHPQIQQEATALLNRANELNQEITGQPSEPAKHSMYADPLELPELKEQITDIQRRIDLGGADGEKAKLELTEIKTDPAKFYENRKAEAKNNLTNETDLNQALETYDNIINKIKQYDKENISGLSGEVGIGKEPVKTEPIEGGGTQEISGGGVLQAQGAEGEGKGVEGKVGEVEATAKSLENVNISKLEELLNIYYHGNMGESYRGGKWDKYGELSELKDFGNGVHLGTYEQAKEFLNNSSKDGYIYKVKLSAKDIKEGIDEESRKIEQGDYEKYKYENQIGTSEALKYINEKEGSGDYSYVIFDPKKTEIVAAIKFEKGKQSVIYDNSKNIISEAYHKAKVDGSNPELVKAVEDLIGKQAELPKQEGVEKVGEEVKDTFENRESIEDNLKDLGSNVYYHGSDDISYLNSKEDLNTAENTKNAESKYINLSPKASVAISYSINQQKIGEKSGVAAFKLKGKGYTMKNADIKTLKSNADYEAFYDKKKSEGYDYVKVPQDANDIVVLDNNAIEYVGKKLNKEALKQSLKETPKAELPEQKEAPKEEVKAELPKQTEEVKVEAEVPEQKEQPVAEVAKQQLEETNNLLNDGDKIRKEGKYIKDGVEYVRNEKGLGVKSEEGGDVRFTSEPGGGGVSVPFKYKLVEAETLQPSHQDGIRNPNHFIWESQPKNRNDVGSIQAEESFANKPRFEEMGENTNAYSGAPVVNERNEVIQGNNRSAGLKKGYQRKNEIYKKALSENAEKFGFSKKQVDGMKNPVLVREVAASDKGAIELGNYDVKDLESGGKRRLDPITITRRMPFELKGRVADILFKGEETLNQAIRSNTKRLMELIDPYLNQSQRNTILKDGNLTEAGIKDLESVVQHFLFDGGDPALPDLYENLSGTQKEALRKSLPYIFSTGTEKSIVPEVQEAVIAINDFGASGVDNFENWLSQSDLFNDGMTPRDKYSPTSIKIADILHNAKTQKEVITQFGQYAEAVKDKPATLYEEATKGISKKEGIKQIFKTEYDESKRPQISQGSSEKILGAKEENLQPIAEGGAEPKPAEPIEPAKPTEPKPADVEPPVPPTISKQGTLEGGEDALRGITMADNAKRREELGMPERKPNPETVEEWTAEAERQIAEGYNINDLIEKMERGEQNSDVENVIARIFRTTLDVEVRKNPSNENIAASERLIKAIESSSSKIGKALRSLQGLSNPFENISDFYVAKKEANKVDNLTDAQKAEVQKDFENIQKAKDEYEKKWKEAEAKFAEMQAQNELLRQQKEKEGKKYTKEGKRDFTAERKDLKEQLKNEIQKYKDNTQKLGISSNGGASDFAITVEMAKIIGKIAKSHVEEVGAKLSDVTQRTFDDVKDLFDGITSKDIHDVIAGKYSERKETKTELLSNLRQVQAEAKLLNELDRVLAREPKDEKQRIEKNQKLADLRRQINDVKKSGGLEEYSEEARAKRAIEANKRKEEKIKERLANNDFDPETKRESIYDSKEFKSKNPKLYNELLDSQVKKQEAELEFHKKLVENEMANMGNVDKFKQILRKSRNTVKSVFAGIDLSAIAIQNVAMITQNPVIGVKSIKNSMIDFWSQKRFDRYIEELHNSPDWNMMKESGLQVSEPKSLLESGKEEMFLDRFKAIIKVKGKEYGWVEIGGKKYELFDVLKPFERAFTSIGNNLRVIKFRTDAEQLYKDGITFENNPEEFKKLATRINNNTSSPKIAQAFESDLVGMAIWSRRLMAAKLNMLGISDLASYTPLVKQGYYRSLGEKGKILSRQQLYAAADLAKFATSMVAVSYLLASSRGGQLNTDPFDNNFMDVELPNGKSYNFTGGFSKYIATLFQVARGGKVNRMTGEFEKYKGFKDRGSEIMHFLRGKMPPISGSIVNLAVGKDYTGKETSLSSEAERYKMPMAVGQIYDQIQKDGYESLFGQGIPTFIGINVKDKRDYMETGLFTKEDVNRPELKTLTDKGLSIPRLSVKETYKVKRDEAHPEGVMTDDEYNQLSTKVHDYMINGWEDEGGNMENGIKDLLNTNYNVQTYTETDEEEPSKEESILGKDLPAEQLKNKLSNLKDKAVKKAIEDMGLTKKSKIVVKEEE